MRKSALISLAVLALLAYACTPSRKHHAVRHGDNSLAPKQTAEQQLKNQIDNLLQQMASEKFTEREAATSALKKKIREIPDLVVLLENKIKETRDPEVRQRLEDILKPIRKWRITVMLLREIPDILERLESQDCEVRHRIAWELGERKLKDGVEPLIRLLRDKLYSVRYRAAIALGKIGDKRAVKPLVEELRRTYSDNSISVSAAEALGKIGDKDAVEPLIAALKNNYKGSTLPFYAARALGRIGDNRAVVPLKKSWKEDKDIRTQIGAAYGLAKITGDTQAFEFLVRTVLHKNNYVGGWASEALAEIGDKRAVRPMTEALKDKSRYVRAYAALVLGNLHDKGAVEPLIKALKDEEWYVRRKAAEALGSIGDERAVKPLIEAFGDHEIYVRTLAAEALGKIGKPAIDPLQKLLKVAKDGRIKVRAAYGLAVITGDKDFLDFLTKRLTDEDWDVRRFAARVLKDTGSRRVIGPLIDALKDEDAYVRSYATKSLQKITKQYFDEDYEKWKEWYEENKKE